MDGGIAPVLLSRLVGSRPRRARLSVLAMAPCKGFASSPSCSTWVGRPGVGGWQCVVTFFLFLCLVKRDGIYTRRLIEAQLWRRRHDQGTRIWGIFNALEDGCTSRSSLSNCTDLQYLVNLCIVYIHVLYTCTVLVVDIFRITASSDSIGVYMS